MTDQTGHPASRAAGDHQLFGAEPHTANEIDRAEEEAESTGTPPKNLLDGMVKALVAYAQRVRIPLIFDGVVDETQCELLRQYDVRFMQGPVFAKVVTA